MHNLVKMLKQNYIHLIMKLTDHYQLAKKKSNWADEIIDRQKNDRCVFTFEA